MIITNISVSHSMGNGLAIVNSNGNVVLKDSDFQNNDIKKTSKNHLALGAGGLHIEFTYCSRDSKDLNCKTLQLWSTNSSYHITNCLFSQNNVNHESADSGHSWEDHNSAPLGKGGGLGILLRERATENNIIISDCQFINNTAVYGGGMHAIFGNLSQNNTLVVRNSHFEGNMSPRWGGGGVHIFDLKEAPKGKHIVFENIKFVKNSAWFGGGLAIHSSPNMESRVLDHTFVFRNCSWEENRVYFAAAVDLSMDIHSRFMDSSHSNATFINCSIKNNAISYNKGYFSQSAEQYLVGNGVFLSTTYTIQFAGETTFSGNNGTAFLLATSTAIFAPNFVVLFENNSGDLGAALSLTGLSAINVQQNSNFTFRQNRCISLKHCPPGFVIHNITHTNQQHVSLCVCAVNTDKSFEGIAWCNTTHYYAYAKRGVWFGYEGDNLHTAHCPYHFCSSRRHRNGTQNPQIHGLITEASQKQLDKVVCTSEHTGILCGKCISVSYHNYDFKCVPNDMCRLGWLLYITSELLPLTLLFLTVIFFNISFTTGTISGFIFFAQVIDSLAINAQGSVWLMDNNIIFKLTEVYQFIYRFFNFDFFSNPTLAFCLMKGATALDVLAFKYVTILYAFVMIFAMVFILNYCSAYFYRKYSCLMKYTLKSSVIHGFSTVLIMCYTQCIRVSFLQMTTGFIYGRGGKVICRVVFRNGEIDYFSEAHLQYAIPAIAFITIALIPPLLLIVYTLHYRVIAALKLDEKQWFNTVSKYISLERMKPLLDSFQSCFKDNCRFFAGLFFLYRFLFLLLFAVLPSYTLIYTVFEIQLIVILALHAHVQPYQNKLHNRLDTLIFTNLAVINAISVLNYSYESRATFSNYMYIRIIEVSSAIQLALILLPLGILAGYMYS